MLQNYTRGGYVNYSFLGNALKLNHNGKSWKMCDNRRPTFGTDPVLHEGTKQDISFQFPFFRFIGYRDTTYGSPKDLVRPNGIGVCQDLIRFAIEKLHPTETLEWCIGDDYCVICDFDGKELKCQIVQKMRRTVQYLLL